MKILLYILTPMVAYLLNLILSFTIIIVTFPLNWFIIKIENNQTIKWHILTTLKGFRLSVFISGFTKSIATVFIFEYLLSLFEGKVELWWILVTFSWLSYLALNSWKRQNPFGYEISLIVSQVIGYIIGILILWF